MRVRRALLFAALLATAATAVAIVAGMREPTPDYRSDQCTAWAYAMRPDLTRGTDGLDAADWEAWAQDHGYAVDDKPRQGDVAVWGRGAGAGPDGHVAYVEAVTVDGGVIVSEQNVEGCRGVRVRRLTPGRQSTASFIHRRDGR